MMYLLATSGFSRELCVDNRLWFTVVGNSQCRHSVSPCKHFSVVCESVQIRGAGCCDNLGNPHSA